MIQSVVYHETVERMWIKSFKVPAQLLSIEEVPWMPVEPLPSTQDNLFAKPKTQHICTWEIKDTPQAEVLDMFALLGCL